MKRRWFAVVLVLLLGSLLAPGLLPAGHVALADPPEPAQEAPQPFTETYPYYETDALLDAIAYLGTQQQADGGIDSFGSGSDPGGTTRAVLALNAAGYPVDALESIAGNTMIDFLEAQVINYIYAEGTPATANLFPGRAGLVLAAVAAAGRDPRSFGGVDLVAELEAVYVAAGDGTYSTAAAEGLASGAASDINQTLAILGLIAAGQTIPVEATDWLLDQQNLNGSWSNNFEITGYAIVVLPGSGNVPPTDTAIQDALDYYRANQTPETALWNDTSQFGEPANSTGWAINALATAGLTPPTASWASGGTNPRAALVGLQTEEGAIAGTFFNAYATLEALYGLGDQPLFMAEPLRVERALTWLLEQQNDDGGWSAFGTESTPGGTLDAIFAFVAAGYDPASLTTGEDIYVGGRSPLDYLANIATSYTRDDADMVFPNETGKLLVGVVAAGADPTDFGADNLNLVADLQATLQPTGAYSTTASRGFSTGAATPGNQAFALLGIVAAGETVPTSATDFLIGLQNADGGWSGFSPTSSPDTTGIVLQALIAAGVAPSAQAIVDAIIYLRDAQLETGGWGNVNSDAYAIQGLLAAGVDLTDPDWLKQGRWLPGTLGSYQKPDGPFVYNWDYTSAFLPPNDNLSATQQGTPVLAGAFYPYATTGTLEPFTAIPRGPDPDRTVALPAYGTRDLIDNTAQITIPFGSDLNGDGTVLLEWSVEDGPTTTITPTREIGYYSATLDLSAAIVADAQVAQVDALDTIQLRAIFSDSTDGVQSGSELSTTSQSVESEVAPRRVYLPLISR